MNRFSIACRAFVEGLATTPSVPEIREHELARAVRAVDQAEWQLMRANQAVAEAKHRLVMAQTRVEQLEKLPDEAFAILAS